MVSLFSLAVVSACTGLGEGPCEPLQVSGSFYVVLTSCPIMEYFHSEEIAIQYYTLSSGSIKFFPFLLAQYPLSLRECNVDIQFLFAHLWQIIRTLVLL